MISRVSKCATFAVANTHGATARVAGETVMGERWMAGEEPELPKLVRRTNRKSSQLRKLTLTNSG